MKSNQDRSKHLLVPPPEVMRDVEHDVMESIDGLPSPVLLQSRRRKRIATGAAVVVVGLIFTFYPQHPIPNIASNEDYTESRIVLRDHTSIWLTPIQTVNVK